MISCAQPAPCGGAVIPVAGGAPKILKQCKLPLTGKKCVNSIVTELAYIEVTPQGLVLREVAPGVTPEDVQKATDAKLRVSPELRTMQV